MPLSSHTGQEWRLPKFKLDGGIFLRWLTRCCILPFPVPSLSQHSQTDNLNSELRKEVCIYLFWFVGTTFQIDGHRINLGRVGFAPFRTTALEILVPAIPSGSCPRVLIFSLAQDFKKKMWTGIIWQSNNSSAEIGHRVDGHTFDPFWGVIAHWFPRISKGIYRGERFFYLIGQSWGSILSHLKILIEGWRDHPMWRWRERQRNETLLNPR